MTCHGAAAEEAGTVHLYHPDTAADTSTVVVRANTTIQSLTPRGDHLYLPLARAGRLDIRSRYTYEREARLARFSGPRHLITPNYKTAVLTDRRPPGAAAPDSVHFLETDGFLYDGAPAPEVAASAAVSGTVAGLTDTAHRISDSPKDRVYVALGGPGGAPRVAVFDAHERRLLTEVDIGCSARFVAANGQGKVFALCARGEAVVLDGTAIIDRIPLPGPVGAVGPGQDAMFDPYTQALYVVVAGQRVTRINTAVNEPDTTLDLSGGGPIGALAYDHLDRRLYVGRADAETPLRARGRVTIHERDGTRIDSFRVGVAPVDIDLGRFEVKQ